MTDKTTPIKRKSVDYGRIEAGWRAGLLSPRQLAAIYTQETGDPVSHAAIIKHFEKKLQIPRSLAAKIKAKSDEQVTRAALKVVTEEVTPVTQKRDQDIIDCNASMLTNVRLSQRTNISRSMKILMSLFDELELQVGQENADLLIQLGELMRKENDKGEDKRNDLYMKIISLQGRAGTAKSLTESLKTVVALERQAFGLDDKDNAPVDALTTLLHGIAKTNNNALMPVAIDPEHSKEDE